MKIQKIIGVTAGTLMLAGNVVPIFARDVSLTNNDTIIQICQDEVTSSAEMIDQLLDGLEIQKEESLPVSNEVTYVYAQQPVYTYDIVQTTIEETITVDEFMNQFETISVDTSAQQAAYQQALDSYNMALAEYETASQMVETSKDVEVEIVEEVTDEEGNVSEVTRTEIQTVTELVPAGDIISAQANLDVAKAALDNAQLALDAASVSQTTTVIEDELAVEEEVTNASSGYCGDNYYNVEWTLDDNGLLTISGTGSMTDYITEEWGTAVKSIVINEGITRIGDTSFWGCSQVTDIILPDGLKTIGRNSFVYCSSLKSMTVPDSVTSIGDYAFIGCDNLTDIYYLGSEKTFNDNNLNKFSSGAAIHFLGKPFPFKDVSTSDWYYDTVKECYETSLISGTSKTTFSPLQKMTRAMVVTILWRMENQPSVAFNNKFKDVSSNQWYATSISWAVNTGVVHGYGDGTFKPDAEVTREQVAVMLANYVQYRNCYKAGTKKLNTYPDGSRVSTYAQAGMKWAITEGIISGNGEGYLNPKKSATRAEGATMLLRMNHWLDSNDPVRIAKREGIVSFVKWLVNNGYANTTQDRNVLDTLSDNLEKYNIDASSISSPFNLDNVEKSIQLIVEGNYLRSLDDGKPVSNLRALKITNYLMLVSSIQNCASWDLYEAGNWDHSRMYNVGENIALFADDPFDGWYTEEKKNYEEQNGGQTGHYLNLIDTSYVTTGFSWGYNKHAGQVFSQLTNGKAFTPDEYLALLKQYRQEVGA